MQVTLIRKKSLNKIILPHTPIGNYWLCDEIGENNEKLINIEGKNEFWQLSSNNYVKILNPKAMSLNEGNISIAKGENILNKVELKENTTYFVLIGKNEIGIVYCSPAYETNFSRFEIKNTGELHIGRNARK